MRTDWAPPRKARGFHRTTTGAIVEFRAKGSSEMKTGPQTIVTVARNRYGVEQEKPSTKKRLGRDLNTRARRRPIETRDRANILSKDKGKSQTKE